MVRADYREILGEKHVERLEKLENGLEVNVPAEQTSVYGQS